MKATVVLFRRSGKYYTEEQWEIPPMAIGPWDMEHSKDFRRIDGGPVLVSTQEPWGYPFLLVSEDSHSSPTPWNIQSGMSRD